MVRGIPMLVRGIPMPGFEMGSKMASKKREGRERGLARHEQQDVRPRDYEAELDIYAKKLGELFADMTRELRESERLHRTIVEDAADAIVTLDEDCCVASWNHAATEIFGYTEKEALRKNIDDLISGDDVRKEALAFTRETYNGGKIRSHETVRHTKKGEPRRVLISATPIMDAEGSVYMISLIYKDISKLHAAHERLIQSEKQATLGIIAGSIGHELNNVVGGLLLQARELRANPGDPECISEVAGLFLSQVEKIANHGENLLSLSRPTKPQLSVVDLPALLDRTTETLVVSGVLKRIEIRKEHEEGLPHVSGDINLLEQVVRNLEINAAHAMESGGRLTVGCRRAAVDGFVEMFISDTGPGIAPAIRHRIFEPFFTTKAEGKGTGLGLPIVKQIIDQHDGFVGLSSEPGEGTTVMIRLPTSDQE